MLREFLRIVGGILFAFGCDMTAFEEVFLRCSPQTAPWYIIPADQKWYRNLAISRVIVSAIREMNPQYPPAEEGLDGITIE